MFELGEIRRLLHEAYIAAEGTGLREEDERKAVEVAALLAEVARVRRRGHLVDAAAGKAYVGVLAARLLGFEKVTVLEREAERVRASREAAERLGVAGRLEVRQADVALTEAWPADADLVAALHACGPASDAVIDAVVRAGAKWLLLVPCCYGAQVPFSAEAERRAGELGMARHAEVRRRLVTALVDAERTLRLEAAGWETTVAPFVAPTVTPHNLLWRARRTREPTRMAEALGRLEALRRAAPR